MTKYKLEYIWLDGYSPVPNLRGKTQIKEFDSFPSLEELPPQAASVMPPSAPLIKPSAERRLREV